MATSNSSPWRKRLLIIWISLLLGWAGYWMWQQHVHGAVLKADRLELERYRNSLGEKDGGDRVRNPGRATVEQPYVNSLGMRFYGISVQPSLDRIPAGLEGLLFAELETRVQDYARFAETTRRQWASTGKGREMPATRVTWHDAVAFCDWLTDTEWKSGKLIGGWVYRLPTDIEWNAAAGLPVDERGYRAPRHANMEVFSFMATTGRHGTWPPPLETTSISSEPRQDLEPTGLRYRGTETNLRGFHGEIWEWCQDAYDGEDTKALKTRIFEEYHRRQEERYSPRTERRTQNEFDWEVSDVRAGGHFSWVGDAPPSGASPPERRVLRGWDAEIHRRRDSFTGDRGVEYQLRHALEPSASSELVGFRCVLAPVKN